MAFGDTEDLTQIARTLDASAADGLSLSVTAERGYSVYHLGVSNVGGSSFFPIILTLNQDFGDSGAPTADLSAEENKMILRYGYPLAIPPGATTIAYRTILGEAMFQLVAGPVWFGEGY